MGMAENLTPLEAAKRRIKKQDARIATLESIVREVRDLIEANGGGYDALASHHYDQLRGMLGKEAKP